MARDVTKDDLTELRVTLSEQMRDGFRGVNERLDRLDNRVGVLERHQVRNETRLGYLEGGGPEARAPLSARMVFILVTALFTALQVIERVVMWAIEK